MTDSPRRDGPAPRPQPQQPQQYGWQSETDPAYAYPPPLFGNYYQSPADANSTQELPATWYQGGGFDPSREVTQSATPWTGGAPPQQPPHPTPHHQSDAGGQPPPPGGPGPRMWLWVLAGVAVLLVIGMVAALFIVSGTEEQTVVAPPLATATSTPRTTTSRPTTTTVPSSEAPTTGPSTTESVAPGATEQVVYNVTGSGKAINITYVDEGGVLQTEFNVMLPWSKTVQLAAPAKDSASVSIVTFGREVSCTITVAGAQVATRTGSALTVCSGKRS